MKVPNYNSVQEEPLSYKEFEALVKSENLLVFEASDVAAFAASLNELIKKGETSFNTPEEIADIEKGRKDMSKLVQKTITTKSGHQKKVWVKNGAPVEKKDGSKFDHDELKHTDSKRIAKEAGISHDEYQKLHPSTKKELSQNYPPKKEAKSHKELAEKHAEQEKEKSTQAAADKMKENHGGTREKLKDMMEEKNKEGTFEHHRMMAGYHATKEGKLSDTIIDMNGSSDKSLHNPVGLEKERKYHSEESDKHHKKAQNLHDVSKHGHWNDSLPTEAEAVKYGENHLKSDKVKTKKSYTPDLSKAFESLGLSKADVAEDTSKPAPVANETVPEAIDAIKVASSGKYAKGDKVTAKISPTTTVHGEYHGASSEEGYHDVKHGGVLITVHDKNLCAKKMSKGLELVINKAMEASGNPLVVQDLEGNNNRKKVDKASVVDSSKKFPAKKREKLADEGEAESDGSYPIRNTKDLKDAIMAIGRSKDPDKTKRWIKRRAKELNAEHMLPEKWS